MKPGAEPSSKFENRKSAAKARPYFRTRNFVYFDIFKTSNHTAIQRRRSILTYQYICVKPKQSKYYAYVNIECLS